MVSVAKFTAYEALHAVLQHEEPAYIETLKRDMERARMQAEDFRGHVHAHAGEMWRTTLNVAEDLRNEQQRALDIIDDRSASRAVIRTALVRVNNAMVDAYSNLVPYAEEDSDDDMPEEDSDDDLHCVICRSTNGNNRSFYNMEPEGRWAGLAPGARIVCTICYRQDMGRIESFF